MMRRRLGVQKTATIFFGWHHRKNGKLCGVEVLRKFSLLLHLNQACRNVRIYPVVRNLPKHLPDSGVYCPHLQ